MPETAPTVRLIFGRSALQPQDPVAMRAENSVVLPAVSHADLALVGPAVQPIPIAFRRRGRRPVPTATELPLLAVAEAKVEHGESEAAPQGGRPLRAPKNHLCAASRNQLWKPVSV